MSQKDLPRELVERVRLQAGNRCGYCLCPQHLVIMPLEIEHLLPRGRGGNSEESNLWLACRQCNNAKSDQVEMADPRTGQVVPLFHPRRDSWWTHFRWSRDGTRIIGRTPIGRATVLALNLNNRLAIEVRRNWISAGWHPPRP
jgi:hypothetical protein